MRVALRPALLVALVVAPAVGAAPTTMPATTQALAIDWSQAAKHVGETATVTGPVMGTHATAKNLILNVGKDYPDPARFTVLMPPADASAGSPDDMYVGKTVTVTGKVKLYHKAAEVVVAKAAGVMVTKDAPAAAH